MLCITTPLPFQLIYVYKLSVLVYSFNWQLQHIWYAYYMYLYSETKADLFLSPSNQYQLTVIIRNETFPVICLYFEGEMKINQNEIFFYMWNGYKLVWNNRTHSLIHIFKCSDFFILFVCRGRILQFNCISF